MNHEKGFHLAGFACLPRIAGAAVLIAAAIAISGCLVITDTSRPHAGSAEVQQPREHVTFSMATERDVDTSYARLKRAFGFQTLDELLPPGHADREWMELDDGYHHRATPGAHYSMRQMRPVSGHQGVIQIDIDRDGSGSQLYVRYYTGSDDYAFPVGKGFQQVIEAKVKDALR